MSCQRKSSTKPAIETQSTSTQTELQPSAAHEFVDPVWQKFLELEKKREDVLKNVETKQMKSVAEKKAEIYHFKVNMVVGGRKQIYRELLIEGSSSLTALAEFIVTQAFGFEDFEHAYGFYDDPHNYHDSVRAYTYFYDMGGPLESYEQSVDHSFVGDVFEAGETWLLLFDYGDDWQFHVKCISIIPRQEGTTYPKVTKKHGNAPQQYFYD